LNGRTDAASRSRERKRDSCLFFGIVRGGICYIPPMSRRVLVVALLCLCAPFVALGAPAAPFVSDNVGDGAVPIDGNWQFKTGDDLHWAQPGLDDSGWEQISADRTWGEQGHPGYVGFAWYRRHIAITPHLGTTSGSGAGLEIYLPPVDDAVEVYWDGRQIGNVGAPPPHVFWYSVPRAVTMALPVNGSAPVVGVLAFRVWKAPLGSFDADTLGGLNAMPSIGGSASVDNMLTVYYYRRLHGRLISWVITLLGSLVMLICFVAWVRDRRQWLFLWIALFYADRLIALVLTGLQFPISYLWGYGLEQPVYNFADVVLWLILLWVFGLNRSRWWAAVTWTLITINMVGGLLDGVDLLFSANGGAFVTIFDGILTAITTVIELYAFVLLFAGLRRRQETPSILVGVAAFLTQMLLVIRVASQQGVRYTHWTLGQKLLRSVFSPGGMAVRLTDMLQILLLASLIYAMWRYAGQQRQRRAAIEAEYKSAQEIQQVLIPDVFEATPGLAIDSVYKPAAEVGGDFFQVIPLVGGDTLVVIGDVSGKGLRAAMTVSLIVGALRTLAEQSGDPSKILAGVNRRLIGRMQGGFATGIVARLSASGECWLANAGHPAPYLNGRELPHSGSLPLGIDEGSAYSSQRVDLGAGDRLVFYTDGVIEARNRLGELYGFSRLEGLLTGSPSAEVISESAASLGRMMTLRCWWCGWLGLGLLRVLVFWLGDFLLIGDCFSRLVDALPSRRLCVFRAVDHRP